MSILRASLYWLIATIAWLCKEQRYYVADLLIRSPTLFEIVLQCDEMHERTIKTLKRTRAWAYRKRKQYDCLFRSTFQHGNVYQN